MPLIVPEIFQWRKFHVLVSETKVDRTRERLPDIRIARRRIGAKAGMSCKKARLHLIVASARVKVGNRSISRFGPNVRPPSIHEIGRLGTLADCALVGETFGYIVSVWETTSLFKPGVHRIAAHPIGGGHMNGR